MEKLATIRKNGECPFGLPIPSGCNNAADMVDKMAPLNTLGENASKEDKEAIKQANTHLLVWNSSCARCKYAAQIVEQKGGVQCSFGDTAAGVRESGALLGSPFYSRVFGEIGLDGLLSYPMGYYADNSTSRNMYYGIYSLCSKIDLELIKLADQVIGEILKAK